MSPTGRAPQRTNARHGLCAPAGERANGLKFDSAHSRADRSAAPMLQGCAARLIAGTKPAGAKPGGVRPRAPSAAQPGLRARAPSAAQPLAEPARGR